MLNGTPCRALPLLVLVFVGFSSLAACGAQPPGGGPASPGGDRRSPEHWMSRVNARSLRGEGPTWALSSPRVDVQEDPQTLFVSSPTIQFFKAGDLSSTLTSEKGWVDVATQDLRAEGQVVVISTQGSRLEVPWLLFENQTQLIRSTAAVRILHSGSVTRGKDLVATPDLSSVLLAQETVEIPPEKKGEP